MAEYPDSYEDGPSSDQDRELLRWYRRTADSVAEFLEMEARLKERLVAWATMFLVSKKK